MSLFILMCLCGALTFSTRFLPLTGWLPAKSAWFERAMYFVPIAALTPIITHSVWSQAITALRFQIICACRLPVLQSL